MASQLTPRLSLKQIENPNVSLDKLRLTLNVYSRTANTRLRALEKAGLTSSPAYRQIKDFARDGREFIGTTKHGEFKFSTRTTGRSREDIQKELIQLHKFLFEAKTSTTAGEKKRRKLIKKSNEKIREDKSANWAGKVKKMSDEEFEQFWDYANLKRFYDLFGSDNTATLMDIAAENPNIKGDMKLLDKIIGELEEAAIKGLQITLADMDYMTIFDEVEAYEPTGQVT